MGLGPDRKMVPCYLTTEGYLMLKSMADDEMRSLSGFLKVLVYNEADERGIDPAMFTEAAQKLKEEKE